MSQSKRSQDDNFDIYETDRELPVLPVVLKHSQLTRLDPIMYLPKVIPTPPAPRNGSKKNFFDKFYKKKYRQN